MLRGSFGGSGRVFSAEPDPGNFALLAENVRSNGSTNVTPLNVAIGAARGSARLFRSAANSGDHSLYNGVVGARDSVDVPVETIDEIAESRGVRSVDFIKMDVQGYEHSVLLGMRKSLESSPSAVVLTEFWPEGIEMAGGSPSVFFDYFATHGFSASALGEAGLKEVDYGAVREVIDRKAKARDVEGNFVNLVFSKKAVH